MKIFFSYYLRKFIYIALSILILNNSADVAEKYFHVQPQHQENEIESIVELIAEISLDEVDFIPENSQNDSQKIFAKKLSQFIVSQKIVFATFSILPKKPFNTFLSKILIENAFLEIISPPPQI
jgi:hypothetical protein